MYKLLLVDDDIEVLDINSKFLTSEGYIVYTTTNPINGITKIKKISPDCIILDIMMSEMDGYEVCKRVRKFSSVPIIFLTGKASEDEKIFGLITGADDYIVKPYSLRELKARIDALIRRSAKINSVTETPSHILRFRNLTIDQLAHKAFYKEEDLELANREYEVLLYMATHVNKEITFEELGTVLFGRYMECDRRSVMVNVSRLRKKMSVDFELQKMITTIWSKGYKFII